MELSLIFAAFNNAISADEATIVAPDLDGKWHYVVADTKFVTIHLNASGSDVGNGGRLPAYKAQMYIYNRALGRLQGYLPQRSFLLGRGWERHQRI